MKSLGTINPKILSAALAAAATAIALSATGCAEPPPEAKASTTAKLLAPRAVFKAKASPVTQDREGIVEWRLYRGRRDVVVTGYDAKGKPVKGLSVGFHSASEGDAPALRTRLLDGSMFAARHTYGGATSMNGDLGSASNQFVRTVLADLVVVRRSIAAGNAAKTHRTLGQCGGDLSAIVTSAIQCVMSSGGASNPAALSQCIAAAQTAGNVGGACQLPGGPVGGGLPTDPFDPLGGAGGFPTGPYDPMGGAGYPGDLGGGYPGDFGGGYPGDLGGGYPGDLGGGYPGDVGGGYPGDVGGGYPGDLGGGMGGGFPGDPMDPFGDSGMCPSCGGMGGYPGDVGGGYPGDFGGGYPGDVGGGYPGDVGGGYPGDLGGGSGDICSNPFNGDVGYEADFGGMGGFGEGY